MAAAVHAFVVKSRSDGVIHSSEIVEIVVAVLSTLGFEKLSEAFSVHEHSTAIHLNDLAAQMGAAFELEFFRQLDRALHAASDHKLSVIEVDGLRACVMHLLRDAAVDGRVSRSWPEEIVEYMRERVARVRLENVGSSWLWWSDGDGRQYFREDHPQGNSRPDCF